MPLRTAPVASERLKPIRRRLDAPPMPRPLRQLIDHLARVTLHPLGSALKLALSVPAALEPPAPKLGLVAAADGAGVRLSTARRKVLDALAAQSPQTAAQLVRAAGVSAGVVQGMVKAGLLASAPLPEPDEPPASLDRTASQLSPDQAAVATHLCGGLGRGHRVTLLEGLPGAGKTEVYLEAVAAALERGDQALVLLPEIALTTQVLERFARRFGRPPAVWHSEIGSAARRRLWRRIAEGREPIVIGARSALFLPLPALGLIVVDEEHDGSFKQEDGVAYQGRDMAIARGRFENCPVLLVSATPALETACLVRPPAGQAHGNGAFDHLVLPARHGGAAMPRSAWSISGRIARPAARGSRRPCARRCARPWRPASRRCCSSTAAASRRSPCAAPAATGCAVPTAAPGWSRIACAGGCSATTAAMAAPSSTSAPRAAPWTRWSPAGPGVERLAEEVAGLLPEARVAILTSDRPATPGEAAALLAAMRDHRLDLLIGTQIIAKGHHFPDLTLVGVVDGDLGLSGGDLRAAERQFQLLYQVAGRAGRAARPGRVLIQTYLPEHPVMQALAAGDKERFYAEELAERQGAGLPPFGRLAALIVAGRDPTETRAFASALARSAPELPGLRVLGPAPAPIALLRGRHRQRLLVIAAPEIDLPDALRPWLKGRRVPGSLRLQIDVDPYGFM